MKPPRPWKFGPLATIVIVMVALVSCSSGALPDPKVAERCGTYRPELDEQYGIELARCEFDERGYDSCEAETRNRFASFYDAAAKECAEASK